MKPIYLGVFLDAESQKKFKTHFNKLPKWKWFSHHMTIKFGVNRHDLNTASIGKDVALQVKGPVLKDSYGMTVYVSGYPSENKFPHITVQTSPEQSPKYSNYLWDNWKGDVSSLHDLFSVKGKVGFWDAHLKKPIFTLKDL